MNRRWRRAAGLVLAIAGLGFLMARQIIGGDGVEKLYESTAILRVSLPSDFENEAAKDSFLRSEMHAMTSDEIMSLVVNDLKLAQEWSLSPERAVVSLRGRTQVSLLPEINNHSRFSLTVRAPGSELTREIASRIATEYQRQGNAKARAQWEEKMRKLDSDIAEQSRRVNEKLRLLEEVQKSKAQKTAGASIL